MKRRLSSLLLILTIIISGCVSAEGKHYEIDAQIHTEDREIQVVLKAFPENERVCIISSLIPDQCIQIPGADPDQMMNALAVILQNMNGGGNGDAIRNCLADWFVFMQPETRTGAFSGDAFEKASTMQHITFSYGDLILLCRRIRGAQQDRGICPDIPSGKLPERNIRFDLKVFDEGKYASLSVLDGKDTVITVSADLSLPDCLTAVAGCGYGGKNYYMHIAAEKKEGRLEVEKSLFADDLKTGFPGLKDDSLICTVNSTIDWAADEIRFSAVLTPADEQMKPVESSGTIRNASDGRVFEGEIRFSGYDGFLASVTADLREGEIGALPAEVIEMNPADENERIASETKIFTTMLPQLLQIISAFPFEYSVKFLKVMGF